MVDSGWLKVDGGASDWICQSRRDTDVVHQRIEPDVGDVIGIERNRDAPVQAVCWTCDAKVLKNIVFEEAENLVAAGFGIDECRILFDVIDQPLLMGLEAKII